jgi:hypothetical protein
LLDTTKNQHISEYNIFATIFPHRPRQQSILIPCELTIIEKINEVGFILLLK